MKTIILAILGFIIQLFRKKPVDDVIKLDEHEELKEWKKELKELQDERDELKRKTEEAKKFYIITLNSDDWWKYRRLLDQLSAKRDAIIAHRTHKP